MPQEDQSEYCSEKSCRERLKTFLLAQKKGVAHFYKDDQSPDGLNLRDASARASRLVTSVVEGKLLGVDQKEVSELTKDLAILALYDMAILIDDSESMSSEENGQRVEILKDVLKTINDIYQHASEPGVGIRAIRFMNNYDDQDNFLGNPYELVRGHYFGGATRIGTELHKRILKPLVLGETPMKKPLLVMVITDGAVEGERKGLLEKVIINCVNKLNDTRPQGADSVAFQFSCIGNDEGARRVLEGLDVHEKVGTYVDCQKATQSLDLSDDRPFTVTKLLLGAIIDKYDEQGEDEEFETMFADDGSTRGPDFPETPPNSAGINNSGYSSNQQNYGQRNSSISRGSNRQSAPSIPIPMPRVGNGNSDHNIHTPQGQGQGQNQSGQHPQGQGREHGVTPEDQPDYHPLAYPLSQPTPPVQNQGAPYPQGNRDGFPHGPEADPNLGPFSPGPPRQLFQDNTSGGFIPGNFSPSQGSYLPHQGQPPPRQHFQNNTSGGYIPGNSNPSQGSYLPHQDQGPSQQRFQNNTSGGYIPGNSNPTNGYPGSDEAQRAQMARQSMAQEGQRAAEEARRAAEEARRSFSGMGGGRSNMSQSEIDELAEESDDNSVQGEHV